jgi:hypothetical protein
MVGFAGPDYGNWGVVYRKDGRFIQYGNGEWICPRPLGPEDAVGYFHQDDLPEARALAGH